jgi:ATPase subunit of ABC transporter with duplicated ATPase domains
MLILQGVTYAHPNKDVLFTDLHVAINRHNKIALIGNNGTGKSTLLRIMAGELEPLQGTVKASSRPYYVPQLVGQYNGLSIAQALQVADKLQALKNIIHGDASEANMAILDDDWTIEERCQEAFSYWQLAGLDLRQPMGNLSGGQKTRVLLAGIHIHKSEIALLDEPSNHLDVQSRRLLYDYIRNTNDTLVVVSHDKTLLNLLPVVYELSPRGITVYGGNYDFYAAQKAIENNAMNQELRNKEKALRKARETERETRERQQKIMMNTFKNNAEKSTAKLKDIHAEKIGSLSNELNELRSTMPDTDQMKLALDDSNLHMGKILVTAKKINYAMLWKQGLDFIITSGERIAIKGPNGSGKTTLIKMILGELPPATGEIEKAAFKAIYIDQDYSLISDSLTVYEQAQQYNSGALQEHEIKICLTRFLFTKEHWDKPCHALSGGEKMRLMLCCLTIGNQAPDMIVLDEPTNNLDLQNLEILTEAVNEYRGTLVVVSHDEHFLKEIEIEREISIL